MPFALGHLRPSFQKKQEELDACLKPITLESDALEDDVEQIVDETDRYEDEEQQFSGWRDVSYERDVVGEREEEIESDTPSETKILMAPVFSKAKKSVFSDEGTLILSVKPVALMPAPAPVSVAPPAPISMPAPALHTMSSQSMSRSASDSWADLRNNVAWTLNAADASASVNRRDVSYARTQNPATIQRKVSPNEIVLLVVSLVLAACAILTIVKVSGQVQVGPAAAAAPPPAETNLVPVPMGPKPIVAQPPAVNAPAVVTPAPIVTITSSPAATTAPKTRAPKKEKAEKAEKAEKPEKADTAAKRDAEILDALRDEQLKR